MKKSKEKTNTLIKRKNLLAMLKKYKIKRAGPNVLSIIEDLLKENLGKLFIILKEELTIQGRKTLKKEDIEKLLEKLRKNDFWET